MAYTEYLDIVIRNQGKLDALDKQLKGIKANLDAINGGPAAVAARPSAQLDRRDLRDVRQTSRLNQARDRLRIAAPNRPLEQAIRGFDQALQGVQEQAADRLNEATEQIARSGRRGGRPLRGSGGGGNGPPDDPDRFRRRVQQVQARSRFAARYGPQEMNPRELERSQAYQVRLRTAIEQYGAQAIKATQLTGALAQAADRVQREWEEIGGAQTRSLTLAQAYARELRAINAQGVQARAVAQGVERLPLEERVIGNRVRAVANNPLLPENQSRTLQESAQQRLRQRGEAAILGDRARVKQLDRLNSLELRAAEQDIAERKRQAARDRLPGQARTAANNARRLGVQANQIDIQRGTPLGDELLDQAANIGVQARRQEQALRKAAASGKATKESIAALTGSLAELQSEFAVVRDQAKELRGRAKEAEAAAGKEQREGLRLGRQNSTPLSAAENIPGSRAFRERQRRNASAADSLLNNLNTERRRLQELAADPRLTDEGRAKASNAVKQAETSIARLKDAQGKTTKALLTTEQDSLRNLKSKTSELKTQVGITDKQQKAQREEISIANFGRRFKQVTSGQGNVDDFESLALGAGFPLLFGGGPGSVAGGLLGSFIGKGFGGQILGGAIGQIVDDLIASTARLGNALNSLTLDFDALREAGVRVSPQLQAQVTAQRQNGDFAGAAETLRRDVAIRTGDIDLRTGNIGKGLQAATTSVNALSTAWDSLRQTVGVGLSTNAAPLIAALAGVLDVVNRLSISLNALGSSGLRGRALGIATGGASDLIEQVDKLSGNRLSTFYEEVSKKINEATGEYQKQAAAIRAVNEELSNRLRFEQDTGGKRTAAQGLTGPAKIRADEEIARLERVEALRTKINDIVAKGGRNPEQEIALERNIFNNNEIQERERSRLRIQEAERAAFRERQDRERALARETEGLLRRQEDLAQARVDQARQELDLQRSIADFRIRTEDQIAQRRADLIRQELEIARVRGQIEDSQISSRFDNQIEAAPDDRTARILSAGKEEELARKALERSIRDGRIETALRIDAIERASRQEQRALENERIALERQRDSVIRGRISIERQTEDLKRDTADYQLSIARQVEDSVIRAANELRAVMAGLGGALPAETGTLINGGNTNAGIISSTLRRKLNLSDVAIAGILGNLQYESPGFGPRTLEGGMQGNLNQASGRGYGIAQWTDPGRQKRLLQFAGGSQARAGDIRVQAEFLAFELARAFPGALQRLRSARNVTEATTAFQDDFLRPLKSTQNTPQRIANARSFLRENSAMMTPPYIGGGSFGGTFGRTGRMSLAPGYGMVDVRGSNRAAVREDAIDIIRANSARGIRTSIGGDLSGDVDVSRLTGEQLARAVEQGIDRHANRVGRGTYAIDLIAPVGTRVGLPLSGISNRGGNTGVAGTTPRGNLALHLGAIGGAATTAASAIPGIGVSTAGFDLKAQAERDKQLQRERQKVEEDLKREELRRREEETLREIVGEQSIVRKREELELASRIAAAGIQQTETEQKLLELQIANTREQELLTEAVKALGPLTKEREEALAKGLENKREELRIAEALLEIEKQRGFQQELVNTQREIQNLTSGIDAGFGVGTQASAAFAGIKNRGGTDEQARRQADAVRTLTLLQETVQDAQSIGGSIGDGIRNALIASVAGGDIRQAFSAMLATIGNTLIQSALRPIEQLIADTAFNLLRPNLTAELASVQQNVAAQQNVLAGTLMQQAATQFMIAAQMLTAGTATKGFGGGIGQLVGSLFSGAGPVSGAFGGSGLSEGIITDLFSGALGFAAGGNPPIGQPSWVGEQGPELSVARGLSTIIPNETSSRLWDSLSSPGAAGGEAGMGGGEVSISYDGPTLVFDSTAYVRQDEVPKIIDRATKQSFGYSQRRLQESPAARRAAGMR